MIFLQSFTRFCMVPVNGLNADKAFLIQTEKGRYCYYLDWDTSYTFYLQLFNHKLPGCLIHKTIKDADGIF